jgi:tellurite resistance protein TehA-like permease
MATGCVELYPVVSVLGQLHERLRLIFDSWFAVTMGTGIVSILLHNLPYNALWIYYISVVFFIFNLIIFFIFTAISVVRYFYYPYLWGSMLRRPSQSLFLGMFPMGFATIITMFVLVCVPIWNPWAIEFAWTMWIIDAVIAVSACVYLPFTL